MILTINQQKELFGIIERNQSMSISKEFGLDFLTDEDIERLESVGVDVQSLFNPENETIATSFHLGMLSEAIGMAAHAVTFDQLKDYIKGGNYIPLTEREKLVLNNIKSQAFNDVKALNGKIFQDVNQVLIDNSVEAQKEFLAGQVKEGIAKKETVRKIANRIAEKTGDWSRNFDRIIEYASSSALEYGKAEMIERSYGEDALCYKRVYEQACKHCIRLYLSNGIGSQPRIFTIKELRANGTNIGRKTAEWLAVIGATHPYCRCTLNYIGKNHKWNNEKQVFEYEQPKLKRKPIRIVINGKESYV